MTQFISNEENLKIMMNLLKDKSKNIQFEAFHVFKVSSNFRRRSSFVKEYFSGFFFDLCLHGLEA